MMDTAVLDGKAWMTWAFEQLQESVEAAHANTPDTYSYPGTTGSDPAEYTLQSFGGHMGMAYKCVNDESRPVAPIDFGTTAAIALVVGNVVTTGFLGDADVIMCSCDSAEIPDGTLISAHHTASEEGEIERINRDFPGKAVITPDGYLAPIDDELGQYEVKLTRSLGHVLLKEFGITSVPEVKQMTISDDGPFALVLCSDGITAELAPHDVSSRVESAADPAEACDVICGDVAAYCSTPEALDDYSLVVLSLNSDDAGIRAPAMSPAARPQAAPAARAPAARAPAPAQVFDDTTTVVGFGSYTKHGTRHGSLSQDDVFCEKVATSYGDVIVAAVFDGHGILGETSSRAAVAKLREIVNTPSAMKTPLYDAEEWMEGVFEQLQDSVAEAHRHAPAEYTYPGKPGHVHGR